MNQPLVYTQTAFVLKNRAGTKKGIKRTKTHSYFFLRFKRSFTLRRLHVAFVFTE